MHRESFRQHLPMSGQRKCFHQFEPHQCKALSLSLAHRAAYEVRLKYHGTHLDSPFLLSMTEQAEILFLLCSPWSVNPMTLSSNFLNRYAIPCFSLTPPTRAAL